MHFPSRFFVAGTDTDVGKTFVSAILTAGLQATYWKPIQSGSIEGTDTKTVQQFTALPARHFLPELYSFKEPLSPHAAADLEGREVDPNKLLLPKQTDYKTKHLLIEGAGGLFVPLNWRFQLIDLLAKWRLPVVLVCRSTLGTLNHTQLSIEALRSRKIPIHGLVLNGPENTSNAESLRHLTGLPILAQIPPIKVGTDTDFAKLYQQFFTHAS